MKPDDFNKSPKRVALPACGIVVFEARHAPGFFGELKDDYAKFCLVIAGRAHWESGGQHYTVATNTFSTSPRKCLTASATYRDNP